MRLTTLAWSPVRRIYSAMSSALGSLTGVGPLAWTTLHHHITVINHSTVRAKYQGPPLFLCSSYISLNLVRPGPLLLLLPLPVIKELLVDVEVRDVNFCQFLKVWHLAFACICIFLLENFRDQPAVFGN